MNNIKRVAVWGTFDLLHAGHIEFLERASQFGDLYVIVIPDEQALRNKGYLPDNDTETRKNNLERLPFVKQVFIDCIEMGLDCLSEIHPDFFVLGYDQDNFWENILKNEFAKKNLSVNFSRLERFANGIHSKFLRKGRENLV